MSDRIHIDGLEVHAHIGVPDEERSRRQKLLVDVDLRVRSFADAALADNVTLTVDYAQLANEIKTVAASRPRKLIETLAEDIAAVVLQHELVKDVVITIEKFILPDTRFVSVEIKRKAPKRKKVKVEKAPAPAAPKRVTLRRKPVRAKTSSPSQS